MDFLNQLSKQISDLFRSMTPGSKIAVGLLLAVLTVSLVFLFSGKVTKSGEYLFAGESFSVTQIQKMEAAFAAEGLSGTVVEGSRIKINGDKAPYIAALVKNKALPPNCYDPVREALNESSPFQLPSKFNASIQNAKANDLKQTILEMPNIDWAKVMYEKGKPQGFSGKECCSATIAVGPIPGEIISAKLAKTIQQTAAGALHIPAADITVTDIRAGRSFAGNLDSGEAADANLASDIETRLQQKISDFLSIVGMTIAINVELDPYKSRQESIVTPNKKPVTKNSYSKTNSAESKAPAPGGRPGIKSNQPNQLVQTANQMNTSKEKGSETITDNLIGGTNEVVTYATGRPKQVNVSIRIPSDYYVDIWKSRNPTPEGEEAKTSTPAEIAAIEAEEITKTKQAVSNLLNSEDTQDASQFVDVTTYQSFVVKPAEAPGITSKAAAWFSKYWTVLGMFGLALFSLRALRSMMRATPVEIIDSEEKVPHTSTPSGTTEGKPSAQAAEMLNRFSGDSHSLRDELSMLVNQDADAAATILRGWIGNSNAKV